MSIHEKIIMILVILVMLVISIHSDQSHNNKDIEACKQAGSVVVIKDITGKTVCLHPGAAINTN